MSTKKWHFFVSLLDSLCTFFFSCSHLVSRFHSRYYPCMDLPQKYTGHDCDCLDVFQCVQSQHCFPLHVVQNRSIFMGTTLSCTRKRKKAVRVSAEILGCCERLHSFLGYFEHHLMQVLIQMSDLKKSSVCDLPSTKPEGSNGMWSILQKGKDVHPVMHTQTKTSASTI